jgi:hypothetical protein
MDYLENIAPEILKEQLSWAHLGDYVQQSLVARLFKDMGYQIIVFDSGIQMDVMQDADVLVSRTTSPVALLLDFKRITEFEMLYIRTTAARLVVEAQPYLFPDWRTDHTPEYNHYLNILFGLNELGKTAHQGSPKFVYWHLISPHPPYVFTSNGEYRLTGDADPGYLDTITYLNGRMLEVLGTIIRESSVEPIILIQADHGLDSENRLAILHAIYGNEEIRLGFYPEITPVNSFRLIFNQMFGADYPLIPDESYFSLHETPYEFEKVRYPCNAGSWKNE